MSPLKQIFFTPGEVAEIIAETGLRVSEPTLCRWRAKGEGPKFVRLGTSRRARVLYPANEIASWLDRAVFGNEALNV